MRIGIISMHRVRNYGSFLQAYGLKRMLEQQGHGVKFIDIEPSSGDTTKKSSASVWKKLRQIDRYIWHRIQFQKIYHASKGMFRKEQKAHLGLEDMVFTAENCDAVVIGSDEIFNCASRGPWKITAKRFGDISSVNRVISYAASCGYTDITYADDTDKQVMERGIANLHAVSVRDENTASFVANFRKDIPYRHLDPVLIYDFAEEVNRVDESKLPLKPYMIVYAYRGRIHQKSEIRAIRAYAKKHGLRLISIGGMQHWCDEYVAPTPFEVLAYFKNAACIVTDTFHGTVISAKYNKSFAVLVRESNANKLEDLLRRLQLEDHAVQSAGDLASILDRETDYTQCNDIIAQGKLCAAEYLRTSLME
ncbi:MAG: polysaccharide pyruvyl transferase family protein [Ruminococcaceae bacterium]|nr:polysaccharide pyruvyl transferase family protein [Oscillospiraceae bacterium]